MNRASWPPKQREIALTIAAVLAVWLYARFYDSASFAASAPACNFTAPCPFVAVPGEGAVHVNVRAGPGTGFAVRAQIDRGAPVLGIARRQNAQGEAWIELSGNRGFAKATLLAPAPADGSARP